MRCPVALTVVVSRQTDLALPAGVLQAASLECALEAAAGDSEPFVVGGGEIYRLAMPWADRLYWTEVQTTLDGDVHFPDWDRQEWTTVEQQETPATEGDEFPTVFRVLHRKPEMSQ